ncbi:MAG TPA: DMT family transporter [Nitrosomonas mobilis]|nr:DMT family transporter [Nitrosomonas mobilis]
MKKTLPVVSLLLGATIWGVAWYPYRILEQHGIGGELSTTLTYFIALLIGLVLFHRQLYREAIFNVAIHYLVWIGLCAGWASMAYTLGIVHGEVMRVLLLFYLAPLWTILFARLLLNEQLSIHGYFIILLSLAGAVLMLWQPGNRIPMPVSYGDWMGLTGGFMFALANVLVRKDQLHSIQLKSLAVWTGATLIGVVILMLKGDISIFPVYPVDEYIWLLLLGVGLLIFFLSVLLQFGFTYTPANQAIIILLFELVVAALAAYFLTEEVVAFKDWMGGLMIVSASLFSSKINRS